MTERATGVGTPGVFDPGPAPDLADLGVLVLPSGMPEGYRPGVIPGEADEVFVHHRYYFELAAPARLIEVDIVVTTPDRWARAPEADDPGWAVAEERGVLIARRVTA